MPRVGRRKVQRIAGVVARRQGASVATPGQAGHVAHVAGAQALPADAVVRQHDVAGDLEENQAEGENIGRLVEATEEDLRPNVLAVALTLDTRGRGPGTCEAKVGDFKSTLKGDEYVGWLQVEMNETRVVYVFEPLCERS